MSKNNTVLVVAPHMDDEVLGVGGTVAKHVKNGDKVFACFCAHRIYDRQFDEAKNQQEVACAISAKGVLGYHEAEFFSLNDERLDVAVQDIIKPLERYVEKVKPDIVYSNFYGDNHQDHRAVFQAVRVAIRPFARWRVGEWCLYETPSSTEQSPPVLEASFLPNRYVDITEFFSTKLSAYHCYQTEKRDFPHPRSEEAIRALAMKRGVEIGFPSAEAFMVMRSYWA